MNHRPLSQRLRSRARKAAKASTARLGLHVRPYKDEVQGLDAWRDVVRLLEGTAAPTILDVGANVGQSAVRFAGLWPAATIHSFEPSPTTFRQLKENVIRLAPTKVVAVNAGVGSSAATGVLLENSQSDMSSFLAQSSESWGETTAQTPVDIITLDDYCAGAGIESVDLLKTDTQGFDFEVVKGAGRLLRDGAIRLVYMEMIFSDLYDDVPSFDEVYRFMTDHGYRFVGVYDQAHTADGRLSWCDLMFMSPRLPTPAS